MHSTMQNSYQLTVGALFAHGRTMYADSHVVTSLGTGLRRSTFADVAARAGQLANALTRLGVGSGDRVGTLCWNTQQHLEAYLAVPSMGSVLHTLNPRISSEQLTYIINHAADRAVIVDSDLLPLLRSIRSELTSVTAVIVYGEMDDDGGDLLSYEHLLAAEQYEFAWPEVEENSAAAMCYTSGTTGNPKGVVYSHRSTYLHSMAECMASVFGLTQHDRVLPIVPMFHANAWGLPYGAWFAGSDLIMPNRFTQAEPLGAMIESERPTLSAAVPTVWADLARHLEHHPLDLSSLRLLVCGGAAVPRHLIEFYQDRGIHVLQAWGMTETSPIAAVSHPPKDLGQASELDWRALTGRVIGGVELNIIDDQGETLPWNGEAVGEIIVRGPWVTAAYYGDSDPSRFHDGWLRTGDVGTVAPNGFVRITDRVKDVVKSGGEWISSVELEAHIMAHPDVVEAAVVGVPDPRWQERPLACVVLRSGAAADTDKFKDFLVGRVPKWWVPERWTFIDEVPKTSVGKFDKKVLRAMFGDTIPTPWPTPLASSPEPR